MQVISTAVRTTTLQQAAGRKEIGIPRMSSILQYPEHAVSLLSMIVWLWIQNFSCVWKDFHSTTYTSSTAQGGGGSFKNRKPIGDLSWCDAKMAERTHWWIERWLSVSPFLSLFLSFSLSLCVSLSPSIYRATFLAIYLSTCLFMYLSIDLFIHLSIKLSIFLSIQPFIHPLTSLC